MRALAVLGGSALVLLGPALPACSDYGFGSPSDVQGCKDSGGWEVDTGSPGSGDSGDTGGQVDDEPPSIFHDGPCSSDVDFSFTPEEIYVVSWDPTTATGTLTVSEAGWYHLYDSSLAESGSSQHNELSYVHVVNDSHPDGLPYFSNCGDEWIIDDFDNESTPESDIYSGTFWLDEGENTLVLQHACPLVRAGQCTDFHDESDPNSTCDSGNANSVHMRAEGVCLKVWLHSPDGP